ncbi:MAG: STAS-like domain-containing protein [Akkermansiaceae bacterium]|nr:STAS-like domain-containing protein [Akkermansiaceae bacterium]MCF7730891.1 STAS-like domain-containing protein [Akkermansiaceae bacterium]
MKLEFHMVTGFGEFLADGHLGNQFRNLRIESVWSRVESVVFDFSGVTNLTDSFVHATFGNMAEEDGEEFMAKVRFKGCSPLVKSFLSIAVGEGMRRHQDLHSR